MVLARPPWINEHRVSQGPEFGLKKRIVAEISLAFYLRAVKVIE